MKKRGVTRHLEMIISFIIFFMFVIFLLLYIRPYGKSDTISNAVLDGIKNDFLKQTNTSLIKIFIKAKSEECFNVNLADYAPSSYGVIIKAGTGEYGFNGNELEVEGADDAFYAYFSEYFPKSNFDCTPPEILPDAKIGSVENIRVISNKTLILLDKDKFSIPAGIDFRIDSNGFEFGEAMPEDANVFSKIYNFKVLHDDGSLITREFVFKAW